LKFLVGVERFPVVLFDVWRLQPEPAVVYVVSQFCGFLEISTATAADHLKCVLVFALLHIVVIDFIQAGLLCIITVPVPLSPCPSSLYTEFFMGIQKKKGKENKHHWSAN